MKPSFDSWLDDQAAVRAKRNLVRTLGVRWPDSGIVDLAGNDYLGLATDQRVIDAAARALQVWGTGATASRVVTGSTALHEELEHYLASFLGHESALLFSSGYLANVGVITALGGPGTLIVTDEYVHASLIDAARLARATMATFAHNSVDEVATALARRNEPRALVVTESVFSVLGDAAPLVELAAVCAAHDALLVVDEAHGLGVTGGGAGSVAAAGLAEHVVVTATLSKALGSQGGVVLGPRRLRDHLINRARTFIFDTGLAPVNVASALAAATIVRAEPDRVARIHSRADRMIGHLPDVLTRGVGAVQSIVVGDAASALECSRQLLDAGFRVGCFRPPSVPDGVSRLRVTARGTLTDREIEDACSAVSHVLDGVR